MVINGDKEKFFLGRSLVASAGEGRADVVP